MAIALVRLPVSSLAKDDLRCFRDSALSTDIRRTRCRVLGARQVAYAFWIHRPALLGTSLRRTNLLAAVEGESTALVARRYFRTTLSVLRTLRRMGEESTSAWL